MIPARDEHQVDGAGTASMGSLRPRWNRGATMLGAAIGIFSLGVLVAIAVPMAQKSVRNARAVRVAGQLRDFARAFESRSRQDNRWPPATQAPGEIPAGMQAELGPAWKERAPLGLRYLWAPDSLQRGRRYRAAIVLWRDHATPEANERALVEEIDRAIDDGDLGSGKFRLGYRDQAFLVLEQ